MGRKSKPGGSGVINGLLLLGLVGVLAVYLIIVSGDAPRRVYTPEQYAFLSYNRGRVLSQEAPVWNFILPASTAPGEGAPDSQVVSAALGDWRTRVRATLDARYEEEEGVIVTVYALNFVGEYHLTYPGSTTITLELFFPFPGNLETLHNVRFTVDGEEPPEAYYSLEGVRWQTELTPGEEHDVTVGYKADGVGSFTYALSQGRRVDELDVLIVVQGLYGSKVAEDSLPATATPPDLVETVNGEAFAWQYTDLIPSRNVRLNLPTRLGFAQRVEQLQDDFRTLAGLAPFLVGLFLAVLSGLFRLSDVRLPSVGYLLTGCGLAFFYPLLTFLSGLVSVIVAGLVAFSLVSVLVLLFLGLMAGWRRTTVRVGLLLIVFLGLFSLGALTPWWRLLLTGGGLLLVGVFMVHYARRPPPDQPETAPAPPVGEATTEETPDEPPVVPPPVKESPEEPPVVLPPPPIHRHCPHCGRGLADDHGFCPGCGHDMRPFHRCASCGHEQFIPPDLGLTHCVRCGRRLE